MILKDISLKKFSPFLPLHMISYTFDCYLWTEKFSQWIISYFEHTNFDKCLYIVIFSWTEQIFFKINI